MIEKQRLSSCRNRAAREDKVHPGFAKRLTGGGSAADFIAAAKRREAFKAVAETGGAYAGGKPRKRGRRSVNGKDGNSKDGKGARQRLPRNPQESTCTRWKTAPAFASAARKNRFRLAENRLRGALESGFRNSLIIKSYKIIPIVL